MQAGQFDLDYFCMHFKSSKHFAEFVAALKKELDKHGMLLLTIEGEVLCYALSADVVGATLTREVERRHFTGVPPEPPRGD